MAKEVAACGFDPVIGVHVGERFAAPVLTSNRMPDEATGHLQGLAGNLTRLITESRWSVADVAERSELPRERVESLMADQGVEPTMAELLRLAGALEIQPGRILEGITWESDGAGGGRVRVDGE